MPKVNINDMAVDGFRVEVGWSNGPADGCGHVQVGTTNQFSKAVLMDVPESEDRHLDGWFVTLDREGLNRLIRSLRTARDAAYGKDA